MVTPSLFPTLLLAVLFISTSPSLRLDMSVDLNKHYIKYPYKRRNKTVDDEDNKYRKKRNWKSCKVKG